MISFEALYIGVYAAGSLSLLTMTIMIVHNSKSLSCSFISIDITFQFTIYSGIAFYQPMIGWAV
jgi:hypothetical protein